MALPFRPREIRGGRERPSRYKRFRCLARHYLLGFSRYQLVKPLLKDIANYSWRNRTMRRKYLWATLAAVPAIVLAMLFILKPSTSAEPGKGAANPGAIKPAVQLPIGQVVL